MKYFIYIIILLVTLAIVAGFFIVGSPQEERLRRFDERRVQDLQTTQGQIISYWLRKAVLPEKLSDLNDSISGFRIPSDPEGKGAYDYQVRDSLSFVLCANFSLSSGNVFISPAIRPPLPVGEYYQSDNWEHKEGPVCFERMIDPELYKPEERSLKFKS